MTDKIKRIGFALSGRLRCSLILNLCMWGVLVTASLPARAADNPNPPAKPVRLIFIHHSTGENWLSDDNGGLGIALRDNNYFVSDTNYGWGPNGIGDTTDIGHWWTWFRGPDSATYLNALYKETNQNCSYSRLATNPGGQNEAVMFKSCFPNSALQGDPNAAVPSINNNPLCGQDSSSSDHTVANAKGIYIDLLEYFKTRQDKLFIVICAPPLSDETWSGNARAFNQWLVNDWLTGYPYNNVFVFDFYNVLTTNGGNADTNDLNDEGGNHHRWWNGAVQHKTDGDDDGNANVLEYSSGDDHPSQAGNLKATGEFLPLLNIAYNRFRSGKVTISGYVKTRSGSAVKNVTMQFSSGGQALTNQQGYYAKVLASGWSGSLTPKKTGYQFTPSKAQFTNVTKNVRKDFTAKPRGG